MLSNEQNNKIQIDNVEDLKTKKIKPSDLAKIYVDKTGQEYKLRYEPDKKKIIIIKIIKGVLDGKFMKNKFDNMATSTQIKENVREQLGHMGKQFLKDKYNIEQPENPPEKPFPEISSDNGHPDFQPDKPPSEELKLKSFDDITVDSLESTSLVFEKISNRLEIVLNNILTSMVFSEKFSYDDKVVLDNIRAIIKSSIIREFQNLTDTYHDTLKGFADVKLDAKRYRDDVKAILEHKPQEEHLAFLRELYGLEMFKEGLDFILKSLNELELKLSSTPETKITARTFNERQKFSDAKLSLLTCKNDVQIISKYISEACQNKLKV